MTSDNAKMGDTSPLDRGPERQAEVAHNLLKANWLIFTRWWRIAVVQTVDQPSVIEKVKAESGLTPRYIFMTCMSAGIAILGLLLSSPAVVIGAMLISPLMGPILGAGFALAVGDVQWMKESGRALAFGSLVAILFCALIVLLSPLQNMTSEIAGRTRPNLFDLLVALFSALAGSYAMIRGREGTIVGVAIATALMPPLAVVGYGLATLNLTAFGGALLLFITNLMTIALSAAVMARIYGFHSQLSEKHTKWQNIGIAVAFVILALPLGYSLRQIAWETAATRVINEVIADEFPGVSRVSQLDVNFDAEPIAISATVLTTQYVRTADADIRREIAQRIGAPVSLSLDQFRVDGGNANAEARELANARQQQQAQASEQAAVQIGNRLALIAGVDIKDVLIDRQAKRATVRAKPLAGAGLATYYTLEQRVSAEAKGWTLEIVPPALALPVLAVQPGADFGPDPDGNRAKASDVLTEAGVQNLALLAWAIKRQGTPVALTGTQDQVDWLAVELQALGVTTPMRRNPNNGALGAIWLAPDATIE